MPARVLPIELKPAFDALSNDLRAVFGSRLKALVAFGACIRATVVVRRGTVRADSLGLVDRVSINDLTACAGHAERWSRQGLQIPLLLGHQEFARSLDAFPLEYDDIIAHHVVIVGDDPFQGISVQAEDLRRACETRAKGHLVHLREGYLEARGRPQHIANLILASASPFAALLGNIARLRGLPRETPAQRAAAVAGLAALPSAIVERVQSLESRPVLPNDEAVRLYPDYLDTVERLVAFVDGWSRS